MTLFAAFRMHVDDEELWDAFDSLKAALVADVEMVFAEQDELAIHQGGAVSGRRIDVPQGFPRIFGGDAWSMDLELPDAYDVVVAELDKALLTGIVAGHCEFCPG